MSQVQVLLPRPDQAGIAQLVESDIAAQRSNAEKKSGEDGNGAVHR